MTRKQKKALWRILVSLALLLCAALLARLPLFEGWRAALLFAVPYLLCGWDVIRKAALNLVHGQMLDEQFLMTVATFGAFAIGEYAEAAAVMLFYQVGEWFQGVAVGRSRRSVGALMELCPDSATVLRDGKEAEVDPSEVMAGEEIRVRPGERVPLDGVIVSGETTLDTAALTGEALPAEKKQGDTVLSGSVNLTGVITVKTSGVYAESTAARIIELAENAAEKKAKTEGFITRFARIYTPLVVAGAVLLAVLPPVLLHQPLTQALRRALVFLVVSCPCALVVSVPLAFFAGIGGAAKAGVLFKGADAIEALAKVDTAVFDKTGTLTEGRFSLLAVHPVGIDEEELLALAAHAEAFSSHPIARSIREAWGREPDVSLVSDYREEAGHGVFARVSGREVYAGNAAGLASLGLSPIPAEESGTAVHLARDGRYLGCLVLGDRVKAHSAPALAALKKQGITTVMLTGDREEAAAAAAAVLLPDEYRAELLPAEKAAAVEGLQKAHRHVAFAGDGLNDAPVLALADAGIAMGLHGTDAAREAADVVLMDDDPARVVLALSHSRRVMRIVRENLVFTLLVKGLLLVLGALGYAGMWSAVFGDVGVLILAVANAVRGLRAKK